ncbi:E3 ubiquitin-protein ligase [Aspergillus lucknowensis]|uniref:RBR-type E3 ubiquitin transferase n=1 Tax=Aspergillus lucknowensis TaxID=176173 RepID=A0ABR4M4S6_9EURO
MMVSYGQGRRRSWHLSLDDTIKDLLVALSSPPSTESDVISPLSPVPPHEGFPKDHCLPQDHKEETTPLPREGSFSSTFDVISPLESNAPWTDCCWSDATTANAVLSLLHKDPLSPPSDTSLDRRSSRNTMRITCSVCLEALEPEQYPKTPIAAGCDHTSTPSAHICAICLSRSLDVQFSNSRRAPLTCPICRAQLSDEEVERWASKPTFLAYDIARTWRILEEDAEFVRCINPGCGYGQLHAGGLEDPVVTCRACGTRTCYLHRSVPWHEGFSCAEYELGDESSLIHNRPSRLPAVLRVGGPRRGQSSSEDFLSQRTIQETTRACPSCLVATEKAGGCKYMRCMYLRDPPSTASMARVLIFCWQAERAGKSGAGIVVYSGNGGILALTVRYFRMSIDSDSVSRVFMPNDCLSDAFILLDYPPWRVLSMLL